MSQSTIKVAGATLVIGTASLLAFNAQWEGRPNTVYSDKLANGLPTVCSGITKHVTDWPIIVGDYWSDFKCDEIERLVVNKTQIRLASCFKLPPTQPMFDAFSSMAHNVGVGGVCASRAMGLLNSGKSSEACRAISQSADGKPVWSFVTKDGKQVFVQGLYNRRKAETAMCLSGVSEAKPPEPTPAPKPAEPPKTWWARLREWVGL